MNKINNIPENSIRVNFGSVKNFQNLKALARRVFKPENIEAYMFSGVALHPNQTKLLFVTWLDLANNYPSYLELFNTKKIDLKTYEKLKLLNELDSKYSK